jgi:uncharacterized membrane protein
MREAIEGVYQNYAAIIVFLHVLSAVIWVGGMIAIRFAVHYSIQRIEDPKIKLGRTLEFLDSFFKIVRPMIGILIVTAVILILAVNFKETPLNPIVHTKEGIWLIMTMVFVVIVLRRNKAQQYFDNGELPKAKEMLLPIAKWMIPLNIALGILAIFLGVTLRGL